MFNIQVFLTGSDKSRFFVANNKSLCRRPHILLGILDGVFSVVLPEFLDSFIICPWHKYIYIVIPWNEPAVTYSPNAATTAKEVSQVVLCTKLIEIQKHIQFFFLQLTD